ncbi:hypothetical protein GLAREA_04064 [Glarea lozoyensis ATCC 20868]|uniref:RTA1 like protein n=1 Tax=Glarea lozoyensis (strain ATCC 20868 / MF5171) TaxID=1116229 RepID=S3CXM6_GLAL2|nr:uncharacterized protein GLAREA_04064 [Glarea lozoyensis ATCC 20868]EPE31097.1 hypothetical protein GLAREA_04064 [Glarea lozoyensis ATCC 20868]
MDNPDDYSDYWIYKPSIVGAAIATGIFTVLTAIHIFRLSRTRSWFCIPFVLGGLFEVIGYASRAASPSNADNFALFILQTLGILLAPILFAASVYMILGRLIRATGAESYALIRVNWITKIFVGGDILCFAIQAGGGGILAGADTKSSKDLGQNIILAGLVLQIVIFVGFVVVAVVYHMRLRARPTGKGPAVMSWERLLIMLYVVSVLITMRNLFRCIEYGLGEGSYLLRHEWPIYVFDAVLMAIVLGICQQWYFGSLKAKHDSMDVEMNSSDTTASR